MYVFSLSNSPLVLTHFRCRVNEVVRELKEREETRDYREETDTTGSKVTKERGGRWEGEERLASPEQKG